MKTYRIYSETFIEAEDEDRALMEFANNSCDFAGNAEIEEVED